MLVILWEEFLIGNIDDNVQTEHLSKVRRWGWQLDTKVTEYTDWISTSRFIQFNHDFVHHCSSLLTKKALFRYVTWGRAVVIYIQNQVVDLMVAFHIWMINDGTTNWVFTTQSEGLMMAGARSIVAFTAWIFYKFWGVNCLVNKVVKLLTNCWPTIEKK